MKTPEKRSTLNAQRSACFTHFRTLELPNSRTSRRAFTLFELLAVLTVIGILLVVLVGAYGSWGTAHALTGATRVLEMGLAQARTLAMTQNAYVAFDYGSIETNNFKTVTGFQSFLCMPTNDTPSVETVLQQSLSGDATMAGLSEDTVSITPAAPFQRLSGHVRLAYIRETDIKSGSPSLHNNVTLFFRPDGSVWSWDDARAHYLCVYTQERFVTGRTTLDNTDLPKPLTRLLRVDLATGLVTVIKPEALP